MAATSTGLQQNVAGALCYALAWVTGIIFILIEPNNRLVRFHAWQSLFTFGTLSILDMVLGLLPGVGRLLQSVLFLIGLVLWVMLIVKTYQGEKLKLPIFGDLAEDRV